MAKSQQSASDEKPGSQGSQPGEVKGRSSSASSSGSGSSSAQDIKATAEDGVAELKAQGQEAISQAQDQVAKIVGTAREQATTQLATQQERAATLLGALATGLQEASRQVRDQDDAMMADYIDTAANQVERLGTALRDQDIGQIISTASDFARRQPALFLAAAVALGFVGTRFLKSSSQSQGQGNGLAGGSSFSRSDRTGGAYNPGLASSGSDWQSQASFDASREGL